MGGPSVIGLYKTEVIRRWGLDASGGRRVRHPGVGSTGSITDASWNPWAGIPPAEFEACYHQHLEGLAEAAWPTGARVQKTRDGSTL
jgi:hypothetical protein